VRRLLLLLILGASCTAVLAPPASAGDANRVPPQIELAPAGQEGIVGPRSEALAFFSTTESEPPGEDTSAEYSKGSQVTFVCALDGRPIRCPAEYLATEGGRGVLLRPKSGQPRERQLPGPFYGSIPVPKHLASGPHTVTVTATDEDGTDPNPPSVTVQFDSVPPKAPELIDPPPRRSHQHKPVFRFSASDDLRLVRKREDMFTVKLLRLRPEPHRWREGAYEGAFEWGLLRCPTLLTCTARARAYYFGSGNGGLGLGIPERLPAGLYEFLIRARDSASNKSPRTTYRFRILPGPPRG
jgi:hypothetical protein